MILFVLLAIACYKWGKWRNWKEYYPTILYVITGDLAYNVLFMENRLWEYVWPIHHRYADLFYCFLVFPPAVILFLSHCPKGWKKTIPYVLAWTAFYSAIEFLAVKLGYFRHLNRWNMAYSAAMYFFAFVLIKLHTVHPLIVWPVSFGFAVLTMLLFGQPLFGA
jgi:hypothetical protein